MKRQGLSGSDQYPLTVTIVLQKLDRVGQWCLDEWKLQKLILDSDIDADFPVRPESEALFGWPGYRLRVDAKSCDGYYQNLLSAAPKLFVICRLDERRILQPLLISLDCDEAAAHMEADDTVFSYPMPEPVIDWLKEFVKEFFRPERRLKRKRQDWKGSTGGPKI